MITCVLFSISKSKVSNGPYNRWTCHFELCHLIEFLDFHKSTPFAWIYELYHLSEFMNSAIWESVWTLKFGRKYWSVSTHASTHHHVRRPRPQTRGKREFSERAVEVTLSDKILRQQSNKGTLLINTAIVRDANENYEKELSKGLFQTNSPSTE
jgi:hypothetical protein